MKWFTEAHRIVESFIVYIKVNYIPELRNVPRNCTGCVLDEWFILILFGFGLGFGLGFGREIKVP